MKPIKIPEVSKADLNHNLIIKVKLNGGYTHSLFLKKGEWGPAQEVWVDNEAETLEFFFKSGQKVQRT